MPAPSRSDAPATTDAPTPLEALDSIRDSLADVVPPTEPIRLDLASASSALNGAYPRVVKHRAAIEARFGPADAGHVDAMPVLAAAALQAEAEHVAAGSDANLERQAAALAKGHKQLFTDARSLANRGLLNEVTVEGASSTQGYDALVANALTLIQLFRANWPAVQARTPVTEAELDQIERDALALRGTIDRRKAGTNRLSESETRARVLALIVRRYGEVRRMIGYLRWWDGDANAIAPSLFARGGARRVTDGPSDDDDTDPTTPVVTPVTPVVPVTPSPNNGGGPFTD